MAFQPKLTPKKAAELVAEWEDGWTVHELTIIYRVSTRTVYRILADHDVKRVRRKQKKRIQRKRKPRELKPCGTNAAYARHTRNGEYPCTPCLEAHAAYVKRFKEKSE